MAFVEMDFASGGSSKVKCDKKDIGTYDSPFTYTFDFEPTKVMLWCEKTAGVSTFAYWESGSPSISYTTYSENSCRYVDTQNTLQVSGKNVTFTRGTSLLEGGTATIIGYAD